MNFLNNKLKMIQNTSLENPQLRGWWGKKKVVGEYKFRLKSAFGRSCQDVLDIKSSRMNTPSIGDWIACHVEENQSVALIQKVFDRQTCFYRKSVGSSNEAQILASNVNYAFIVTSANLDFNWARMERYLSIARDSGALPIVLITKAELNQQPQDLVEAVRLEFPGVVVYAVSVMTGMNVDELRYYFVRGKTSVFIGSSGVGKSTLANYLLGDDVLETSPVRGYIAPAEPLPISRLQPRG